MTYPIICTRCNFGGEVLRVTASLQCPNCNTGEYLDLNDKTASGQSHHTWITNGQWDDDKDDEEDDEDNGYVDIPGHAQHGYDTNYNRARKGQPQLMGFPPGDHANYAQLGYEHGLRDRDHGHRQAASPGTGWTQTRPDPLANWNEYAGPTPGGNENLDNKTDADATTVCPICHGSGTDPRASGGGYDEIVCRNCHGTGKVVYPTGQPQTESNDAHKPGPVPLGGGWQGKQSVKVIIDGQTFEAVASVDYVADEDKLNKMAAKVKETNPGLTEQECRVLAGRALDRYREGRS